MSVGRGNFSRHSANITSVWKSLSSRTWYQNLDDLEAIINDAPRPSSKICYRYFMGYSHDQRVPEENIHYLNSVLAEDRKYFSVPFGLSLPFLQRLSYRL